MKLSLTQENLHKALSIVSRVASTRSNLPVLSNILLSTSANRLRLAATNLEIGVNYWIGCKVEQEGSITVPARLFSEFIATLPSQNIELSQKDLSLAVKAPGVESTINGISADEFPLIPELKTEPVLELPVEALQEALTQVVIAASQDEARPILTGVYIYSEEKSLVLVATDSYRLAEKRLKLAKPPKEPVAVIVPARTMQELGRVLAEASGTVKVYLGENQVMFATGNVELTSRLIEGKFPDYRQIIPKSTETSVDIDTAELTRITKVASLFARENAGSVRLDIKSSGQLAVVSNPSQVGENTSTADCSVSGEDGEISLNARYLTDALGVIKTEQVLLSLSGKLNPCVLAPSEKPADYLHIIMPLRT